MKISRDKTISLIEEKISKFQKILENANYNNSHNEEYQTARDGTKALLAYLFSEAEAEKFKNIIEPPGGFMFIPGDQEKELQDYKRNIEQSIIHLKDYNERIKYFYFNGEIGEIEEKIIEKTLLLMRFYEEDKIYEIGKKMKLPYFDQFKDYRNIGYHRGALEISRALEDKDLLKLTKENTPEYGLSLGGFQGKYYKATENGKLTLGSSWEKVTENVEQSLDNWGKKAYGVLKAIVDKCGTALYIDIADEIEKILGPGYSWSDLLPRLVLLKLVFNTGRKGHPIWTMPPEIIPIVQKELLIYEEPVNKTQEISRSESKLEFFEYDIAISFAGEDREIAEELATKLQSRGVKVFYDEFCKSELWGKKLTNSFQEIYGPKTRFVVILISKHYPIKDWTDYEFSTMRKEAKKRKTEFILPVRLDDTKILGIHEDIAYLDYKKEGINGLINCLLEKLVTI